VYIGAVVRAVRSCRHFGLKRSYILEVCASHKSKSSIVVISLRLNCDSKPFAVQTK